MDLYLDLHASVTSVGSFVEGKKFDNVFRMEKHLLLPKLLGKITPDFDPENCVYANEPLRPGTPIRYSVSPVLSLSLLFSSLLSEARFLCLAEQSRRIDPK